jgi:hypothetical protein
MLCDVATSDMLLTMLTRPEAATVALYLEGGEDQNVDTEDVALRAAEVAPGMFAWQKHRDRIDKELVRVALSDARLKTGYVIGSHAKGWMLTPQGLDFARRNANSSADGPVSERRRPDERQWQRERARLVTSDAFLRIQTGGADSVTPDETDAFFRLNVYVKGAARERKIARIENRFSGDPELGAAVRLLAARARERTK